ncbi:endonuclease IV [Pelotomaculum thermopropionicum SI]|uniref:Endonuclease IV n=1 Tax=Pelotomaculum thermopropionicum (strain DSM 13744 / JCM 10971 / SI) TaxID=370438 RepID=A5D3R9_PELTS|nr:endonuclease IV [Pelotomaculum thermopropionicum SI]
MVIHFGPAGASDSFYAGGHRSSLEMPEWLAKRGLNAFEYQCGRGVNIGEETAARLGGLAAARGIEMSLHAPYYINLSTADPAIREKTRGHLLKAVAAARAMKARTVVFHPGAGSGDRRAAFARAKALLKEILLEMEEKGITDVNLAPETMGKKNQLGTLEEILELCELGRQVVPAVDFGHMHALTGGGFSKKSSFAAALDLIERRLGRECLQNLHIHFSPIEYTAAGEKRHWTTLETRFGPDFTPLAELIAERGLTPTVICESAGRQAEDAMVYRDIYLKVKGGK